MSSKYILFLFLFLINSNSMKNNKNGKYNTCSCSKNKEKYFNSTESNDCSPAVSYLNSSFEPMFRQGVCSIDDREDSLSEKIANDLNSQETKEGLKVKASLDYIDHQIANFTNNLASFTASMQTDFNSLIYEGKKEEKSLNSLGKSMTKIVTATTPSSTNAGSILGYIGDGLSILAMLLV